MAETPDEVKIEIARTRDELSRTFAELDNRLERAKRRIPFYGMRRGQLLAVGGTAAALMFAVFLVFYARQHNA